MRITKLELHGFKSFPDRTSFHFGGGISCVVGPNGSGKSNVVDALKWCIGEQSARSLRGSEMADVIFAGSTDRKPVGFAEVQLSLAADSGEPFPGAYAHLTEVQVGRRLHRTGTSEYLINGVRCRRRDVLDLFLDTGIANDLYSFIEQGQVDKMVSASAQERRTLIDEAAGISRYKSKRAEATSRLEATALQLDRVADVLDEMGRRLRTLERQALRAAQFRSLRARIRQRELLLSLVKFQEMAADRRALRQSLQDARTTEAGVRRELARRENDLAERREEAAVIDEAVGTWRDAVAEHDARQRELESVRQLSARRKEELGEQRTRALEEQEAGARTLAQLQTEAEAATQQVTTVQSELTIARETSRRASEEAGRGDDAVREHTSAEQAAESRLAEVTGRRATLAAQLAAVEAELLALPERREEAGRHRRALQDRRTAIAARVVELGEEARQAESVVERRAATASEAERWAAVAAGHEERTERAHREDLEQARRERAALVAAGRQARARGQAWVDAEERAADARVRQTELSWRHRLEAAVKADQARLGASRQEARLAVQGAVIRARDEGTQRVAQAQAQLEQTERAQREHARRTDEAREELSSVTARAAEVRARAAGLARSRGAEDKVLAAVQELEPGATTVLDALPEDLRELAAEVLGDRVLLPWVRDPATLVSLAERLGDGDRAAVAVWRDPADRVRRAARGELADVVGDDGGTELAGPGFRLRADGVVELGEGAVEAVLAERRELASLAEEATSLQERRAELAAAVQASEQAVAEARAAAERAGEVVAELRARLDQELERVRAEAEASAARQLEADAAAAEQRLQELRAAQQADLAAVRTARDAEREAARARLEEAVVQLERVALPDDPSDDAVRVARARRRAVDMARGEHERSLGSSRAALERATLRLQAEVERESEAVALLERADAELQSLAERQEAQQARAAELAALLGALDDELGAAVHTRDEHRRHRMAAEVQARASGEERSAASARLSAAEGRLADAGAASRAAEQRVVAEQERLERLGAEVGRLAGSLAEADQARATAAAELETLSVVRAEAWDRLQRERERAERSREGLREAEQALRGLLVRREEVAAEVQRLTDRARDTQSAIEVLRQRMDERYQVSLPGLLDRLHTRGDLELAPDDEVQAGFELGGKRVEGVPVRRLRPADLGDEDGIREALEELETDREALGRLGEVHLGALQEFGELEVRHDELRTQREDLEESMRTIRSAIAKMNRTCRERFREAFDRVNEEFQQSYPQLLGGGSARLSLTDEEDLLETGVDIFVQPPGKRLQHLTLLSGGEKAMTAIALLIALFRVKPSPFCVLDEVDAPLDEANGARFNDMLREMSRSSQFVVITHNRKTMECADTLYGVTMARPGVSRLVSVSL